MLSEHGSRLTPDLFPSNLSLSVHTQLYDPLQGHTRVQWPPLPAHVKAVLISRFNTARTFVLNFLAFKSRNCANVHFLWQEWGGPVHAPRSLFLSIRFISTQLAHLWQVFCHSSPVTTQMCTCYGSFRVMVKGFTYERVHTDIVLYMCVHIIQRYDDTMREKGGEGRERKERDNQYI